MFKIYMFPCWENKSDDFGTKKNGVQVEKPNQAIYISFWYWFESDFYVQIIVGIVKEETI